MTADPIAGLRPPRWPEPPPFLSSGDLVAAVAVGIFAAALIGLAILVLRRRRALSPRAVALARIEAADALDPAERLAALATALRAFVAAAVGEEAARSKGEDWLERLDAVFGTRFFTAGDGRLLGEALYRPAAPDAPTLGAELRRLIRSRRA